MVSGTRPTRADYYTALASSLPTQALVVTSLGNASYLWAVVHHAPENFYIEDAMGLALPLALGLAISQPKRPVIVIEGDGALLMHMGALVTVGAVNAANLTVLLVQNGVHAASGGQVLTNSGLDLAQVARAAGIVNAENIATPHALAGAMRSSRPAPLAHQLKADHVRIAEPPEMPQARALRATPVAETKVFIPPPPVQRATHAPRLPSIEDFPFPGQKEFRARRGELAEEDHPEKRPLSLLQRLAAVGLGRHEDEQGQEQQQTPKARPPEPTKRQLVERDLWDRRHAGQ